MSAERATSYDFTPEEIAKCRAAMDKPAPLECLRAIAAGNVRVELTKDGRDLTTEYLGERMFVAGGWPLFRAGMIGEDGKPTALGIEMARLVP